jgi:hypothetical protein
VGAITLQPVTRRRQLDRQLAFNQVIRASGRAS